MNLYFETCLPILKKPFVNLSNLHCHPYSWLQSNSQPVTARNGRARAHWQFNLFLFVTYFVFVTYRTTETWLDSAESHNKKFYMLFVWLLCVYSGNAHLAVLRTTESFVPFIRGYVAFLQAESIQDETADRIVPANVKTCKMLMTTFYYSQWSLVVSITTLNLVRPASPEFLSSLLIQYFPENSSVQALAALASSGFQAYIFTCIAQVWTLLGGPLILFMFTIPDFLSTKRTGSSPCNEGIRLGSKIRLFRCLQLFTDDFNRLFALFYGVEHADLIVIVVIMFYGCVRTEGVVALFQGYLGLWGLLTYLQVMNSYAEISRRSRSLLRFFWGCSGSVRAAGMAGWGNVAVVNRELKSFRELRIKAGSVFYFDKELLLTVVGIILSQLVNLLILH